MRTIRNLKRTLTINYQPNYLQVRLFVLFIILPNLLILFDTLNGHTTLNTISSQFLKRANKQKKRRKKKKRSPHFHFFTLVPHF